MGKSEKLSFYDEISRNKRNSIALVGIVFMIFIVLGYVIAKAVAPGYFFIIMVLSIIFSMTYILSGYYNSEKIALASVNAKKASKKLYKDYYDLVEGLCIASGLSMPKLYVMPMEQINAFASGRDPKHAVICVSQGALDKLDRRELEGVLAHELSHIANYDIRFMTLSAVLIGMTAIISEIFLRSLWFGAGDSDDNRGNAVFLVIGIILAILAPISVKLIQLAISRKREFNADATAVKFTRYPKGLINALKKIKKESDYIVEQHPKTRVSKAIAPLFFSNPIKGWTSTHPPLDERINRLERM